MNNDDSSIKQPMIVRLFAGEVLVAELTSATLFSAVLNRMILHKDQQLTAPIDASNGDRV